jgi:hypothetical protein
MDKSRIAALRVFADLPAAELDELAAAMREVDVDAEPRSSRWTTMEPPSTSSNRERPMS